jgi:hypothetical protein
LESQYDQLLAAVDAAPFMAQSVRQDLDQVISTSRTDARAGNISGAIADLQGIDARLQAAVVANQAAQYTAAEVQGQVNGLIAALGGRGSAPSSPNAAATTAPAATSTAVPSPTATLTPQPTASSTAVPQPTATPPPPSGSPSARPTTPPPPTAVPVPASPTTLAALESLYDRLNGDVSTAPVMAPGVRDQLELRIAGSRQAARAGKTDAAISEMNTFVANLQTAVKNSQATQFSASRMYGEAASIVSALNAYKP